MVFREGFEPSISRLSFGGSNHLSCRNRLVGLAGVEPASSGLQPDALPVGLQSHMAGSAELESDAVCRHNPLSRRSLGPPRFTPHIMVTPVGFEPTISGLRGRRPDQLDGGAILEMRAGFEPAHNRFAICPLKPISGTASYLAGIAGLEPAIQGSKPCALAAWRYPNMVIRAGLEPVVAAVKERCPIQLDERTMCREEVPCESGNRAVQN